MGRGAVQCRNSKDGRAASRATFSPVREGTARLGQCPSMVGVGGGGRLRVWDD